MAFVPLSEQLKDDRFALARVQKLAGEAAVSWHDDFVSTVEKRYKAYRGVLERRAEAAKWTSKLHPPILFQVIETMTANLIDSGITYRVRPRARPGAPIEERQRMIHGAKAMKALLDYENGLDDLDEKQRPFSLEASIVGISWGKVHWAYQTRLKTRIQTDHEPIHDPFGNLIGYQPVERHIEEHSILRDGPCFEVCDPRDMFWDESGTSVETCRWVAHRVWATLDDLYAMQKAGVYKNVDEIPYGADQEEMRITLSSYEDQLLHRNRTKGLVEVIEFWTDDRVIAVADRSVVIRNDPNPFEHGQKPFVAASTMPQPFQIGGMSDVEVVAHLQDAAWLMLNQRIDNVALLNNSIILMRSDIDDPDDYEFGPGERWLVDDVQQVTTLQMNDAPATISLESEQRIKADIMDITGGMPFTAGLPDSVENATATGASIYQTVAQKRLAMKKQSLMYAWRKIGRMKAKLLQQFVTEEKLIPIIGPAGAHDFMAISPSYLQGEFDIDIEPVAESFMRQERRAEKQAMFQAAIQAAPVMAAVGQPLNLKEFANDWLESYDVTDPERFFLEQQQAQGAPGAPQQGGGPQQGGQNPMGSAPNAENAIPPLQQSPGVTNPALAAGPMSPSATTSISPVAALQQSLAMRGGGRTA